MWKTYLFCGNVGGLLHRHFHCVRIQLHQNSDMVLSMKYLCPRRFINASEFQDVSVTDFNFDENRIWSVVPMIVEILWFFILLEDDL